VENKSCDACKGWGFIELEDSGYVCAVCEGSGLEPTCDQCNDSGIVVEPRYDGLWVDVPCDCAKNN